MTKEAAEEGEESSPRLSPSAKLRAGLQVAGSMVAKLNIGSWINELEQSQVLADDLEELNAELQEEAENKILVAAVKADCLDDISSHLDSFLAQHHPDDSSSRTYEAWIRDLHPDNVADDGTVDARFFATNSDHKFLWNQKTQPATPESESDAMVDKVASTTT